MVTALTCIASRQVRPLIDCSPMREGAEYYWWRAVSATYITRPNKETLALLAQHSTLPLQDYNDVISMFVRHGDKVSSTCSVRGSLQ
jgi:hypothetical protein